MNSGAESVLQRWVHNTPPMQHDAPPFPKPHQEQSQCLADPSKALPSAIAPRFARSLLPPSEPVSPPSLPVAAPWHTVCRAVLLWPCTSCLLPHEPAEPSTPGSRGMPVFSRAFDLSIFVERRLTSSCARLLADAIQLTLPDSRDVRRCHLDDPACLPPPDTFRGLPDRARFYRH